MSILSNIWVTVGNGGIVGNVVYLQTKSFSRSMPFCSGNAFVEKREKLLWQSPVT